MKDLPEDNCKIAYIDDSDDDLEDLRAEEMHKDEELQSLMDFVFGHDTKDEDGKLALNHVLSHSHIPHANPIVVTAVPFLFCSAYAFKT